MAKTDFPTWMKFVVVVMAIGGTIFTWGVAYSAHQARISSVEETDKILAADIKVNRTDIEEAKEDRHRMQIDAIDVKNVAVQSAQAFVDIKIIMTDMQKTQAEQATVQAVNSAKLESLTKD